MINTSTDNLINLIKIGESQTIEFKSMFPSNHVIASNITAFANSEGGIIFLGIGENGEIIGLSDYRVENARNRLKRISESLSPPISINIGILDLDLKKIVYAIVEKAPNSVYPIMTSSGQIYERKDTNVILTSITPPDLITVSTKERLSRLRKKISIFIAMSFREEDEPALADYYQAMVKAIESANLPIEIIRVDLIEDDYEISQKILSEIDKSDIVIADFTLNSPNVYFELGYARGRDRYIIQTARKGTILEFDIRNWPTLFYRNASELEKKLTPKLNAMYSKIIRQLMNLKD